MVSFHQKALCLDNHYSYRVLNDKPFVAKAPKLCPADPVNPTKTVYLQVILVRHIF
jgi:hypothetical protein